MLDDRTAVLTGTMPHDFAAGILAALNDPARSAELGRQARELPTRNTATRRIWRRRARRVLLSHLRNRRLVR